MQQGATLGEDDASMAARQLQTPAGFAEWDSPMGHLRISEKSNSAAYRLQLGMLTGFLMQLLAGITLHSAAL